VAAEPGSISGTAANAGLIPAIQSKPQAPSIRANFEKDRLFMDVPPQRTRLAESSVAMAIALGEEQCGADRKCDSGGG
jgi:hypothetical protein